jgi:hypothetical protein
MNVGVKFFQSEIFPEDMSSGLVSLWAYGIREIVDRANDENLPGIL